MRARPRDESAYELTQRGAERSEGVLHAWRNFGVDSPRDQSVALQAPQRHGQHALADPIHLTSQLVEAQRSRLAEHVDDGDRPFVADASEDVARVTVRRRVLQLRRSLGWGFGHWLLRSA